MKSFDRNKLRKMSIEDRLDLLDDIWESVQEDALTLGPKERKELLQRLDDIEQKEFQLTPAQEREVLRRLKDLEENPEAESSWEEAKARILDPARRCSKSLSGSEPKATSKKSMTGTKIRK